jgi:hypothetical protein
MVVAISIERDKPRLDSNISNGWERLIGTLMQEI